jgi:hypothetical protein
MIALCYLLKSIQIDKETLEKCIDIGNVLFDNEIYENYEFFCFPLYEYFFNYFVQSKLYENGKNYFLQLYTKFKNNLKFHNFQTYILYFSYLSKNYEKIDDLLNQFIISTNFKDRKFSNVFSMYAFYKGEILLNQEKFIHSAFSFGYNLIHVSNNNESFIDLFQIESIKRLCLLQYILPKEFFEFFHNYLERFKKLKIFSRLNPYFNIEIHNFDNFIEINKENLKKSNIYGLSKLILKELRFKQIQGQLKKYKRIKLSKLTAICGLEYPIVKNILELYVCKNKINIKFDEIEDIIEVIDAKAKCSLDDLQEYYKYLNQVSTELYIYNKNVIKEFRIINQLNNEEKQKLFLEKKKDIDEFDDED